MADRKPDDHKDIEAMTFEAALAALEEIVGELESGSAGLEESIRLYERGERLKARCQTLLKAAEARVEKITLNAAGEPAGSEPLEAE